MSKSNVFVYSLVPNIIKELRRTLPLITFYDVTENTTLLKEAEIIIADYDLMAPHIYNLPNLKWLQGTWAGLNTILPYIDRPLPFILTRFSGHHFGQLMSEYVISQIVHYERDFNAINSNQNNQIWDKEGKISNYRAISELTIGIMGLGKIGSWVGKCLNMLGAKILGYGRRPNLDPVIDFVTPDCYYTTTSLSKFLNKCDYIINILPTTQETTGLLNGDVLKSCKEKRSVFINVGRGTIIKEKDLVEALKNGWISKAILDVFEIEPLPKKSPLWTMKEVIITPHCSAHTKGNQVAEQLKKILNYI